MAKENTYQMGFFKTCLDLTWQPLVTVINTGWASCIKRLPTAADLREAAMGSASTMSVSKGLSKTLLTLRKSVVLSTNTHSPYHPSWGISPERASSTSALWWWAPKKMNTWDHALEMNNSPRCFSGHVLFSATPRGSVKVRTYLWPPVSMFRFKPHALELLP